MFGGVLAGRRKGNCKRNEDRVVAVDVSPQTKTQTRVDATETDVVDEHVGDAYWNLVVGHYDL